MAVAANHLQLLLAAKWQSYRNNLRHSSIQRAKFFTAVLTYVFAASTAVGSALAFCAMGYAAAFRAKPLLLDLALVLIFGLWQAAPIIFETASPTISFRDIARYPITLRTYYLLHLAFGLLDPAVLLGLAWLVALWLGILLANPFWALKALVPFLIFAVFNLLANRALLSLLERVLATRRSREIVMATIMFLTIAIQIVIFAWMPRAASPASLVIGHVASKVAIWLPPVLAASATTATMFDSITAHVALVSYSLVAGWVLRSRLRANFHGESYSESIRRTGAVQVRRGRSFPFLGGRMSAIVEKELRYHLGDSRTLVNLATPSVLALLIVISGGAFARIMFQGLHIAPRAWQVYPSAASMLVIAYIAYNSFGLDAAGFARWTLSPARSREILLAKNLALCWLWGMSLVVVNFILIVGIQVSYPNLLLTLIGVTYAALMFLAAGNQLSVRMPSRFVSGTMTRNLPPGVMLVSMSLVVAVGASVYGVSLVARWYAAPWITPGGLLALTAIAAVLYVLSLNSAARYLDRNAEKIFAEIS